MAEIPGWEVIGGADKGGIIVRAGRETSSRQEDGRLSTGAVVQELELTGERLHYRILQGSGPKTGWVSVKLKDKDLVARTDHARKVATRIGKENAERGPGPHNGPTAETLQQWISVRQNESSPEEVPSAEESSPELAAPSGWLSRCGLVRVANFRDTAGPDVHRALRCEGGRIRRGLLFRTGQLTSATDADLKRIRDEFGIKTYIDLRTGETFEAARGWCYDEEWYPPCPSGRHKHLAERAPGELRRVHCPFTKSLKMRPWTADEKALRVRVDSSDAQDRRETCSWWYQQLIRLGIEDLRLSLCAVMRAVLFINYDEILRALEVLTDARNYPVAYGCMAGKDRTGLLGQLVLSALGVSEADIMADYLATNQSSAHVSACIQIHMAMWHDELKKLQPKQYEAMVRMERVDEVHVPSTDAGDDGPLWEKPNIASDEKNLRESMVYKEILQYTFHVLDTECGGVINYLSSIGFGADHVQRLRDILVEKDV